MAMIKMTMKKQNTISILKCGNGTVDNMPRKVRKLRFYCVFCYYIRETQHEKGRKVGSESLSVTCDTIKSANRMFRCDRDSTLL